jgi:GR25 family glycosyltransferase involved in LPS biosynthesis
MNNFDWRTYLNNYPDLVISGIRDKRRAFLHYSRYGKNEGRTDKNINISDFNKNDDLTNKLNYNHYGKNINDLINGIDYIVWINLERCSARKDYMNKLFEEVNIKNERIDAIDGTNFNFNDNIKNISFVKEMTIGEKACTLSHLKAINYLSNIPGKYFMICEDDISFENTFLFNTDLTKIIKDAPNFDILQLSKIYINKLDNLYTKWKSSIFGTGCYIISKEAILKICSQINYDNELNIFKGNINFSLSRADNLIYSLVNTIVYKYNFISLLDEDSSIHVTHLFLHKKSSEIQKKIILSELTKNA